LRVAFRAAVGLQTLVTAAQAFAMQIISTSAVSRTRKPYRIKCLYYKIQIYIINVSSPTLAEAPGASPWCSRWSTTCTCKRSGPHARPYPHGTDARKTFGAAVQSMVCNRVLDVAVVPETDGPCALLSGVRDSFEDATLTEALQPALVAQGALMPPIKVRRMPSIPQTAAGKTPLLRSNVPRTPTQ
jgi:hypothetical protein